MSDTKAKEFEDLYTKWKIAKKNFTLCEDDVEPSHTRFGLSDWEGNQIRKRVNKEQARTF